MKIKVLVKNDKCFPIIFQQGDWIDLCAAKTTTLKVPHAKCLHKKKSEDDIERTRDVVFSYSNIPLGIAMQLPKGFEAILVSRSSTFKNYGIIQTNAFGVIDNTFCGPDDEWQFPIIATRDTTIPEGINICQFRIQLSQKATIWQKLKWLFSSKVELVPVTELKNSTRGGFGEGTKSVNDDKKLSK